MRRQRSPRRNRTRSWRESDSARNGSVAHAPRLPDVPKAPEHGDEATALTPRYVDQPLLKAWPLGYENGGFRVIDGGVLLSARGMPTLFLKEAEKLAAAAE